MPIPAAFALPDRVAVVPGAGSPDGIGFATARLLAELGAAVMLSATSARIEARADDLRQAGFDAAGGARGPTRTLATPRAVGGPLPDWGRAAVAVHHHSSRSRSQY